MAAPPTRRGQEFAAKADLALREGRLEEAKTCHKHAWTAFKEARDALLEGDTNTKMALKILIDYHRDREKNPGDPKHILPKPSSSATTTLRQIQSPETVPPSASSSTNSLQDAWSAVQEVGELLQGSATPPPIPEPTQISRQTSAAIGDWRKGNQSIMMAESFLIVGNEATAPSLGVHSSSTGRPMAISSPDRGHPQNKVVATDFDRLVKENSQLRSLLMKEREESKQMKERFWRMFVLVKSTLEETNVESDLKALTRLLHNETEARKKAEAEVEALRRSFA